MLRAPIWRHVGVLGDELDRAGRHHLGDDRQARQLARAGEQREALLAEPLERVRRGARLERAAAQARAAPAAFAACATASSCSQLSTAHGPAMTGTRTPPNVTVPGPRPTFTSVRPG